MAAQKFDGRHWKRIYEIVRPCLYTAFIAERGPELVMLPSGSSVYPLSGGLAMVGDAGPELLRLPAGSSVYPMTAGGGFGGGNITPISLGGGGSGGGPVHIHNHFSINGRELVSLIGPDIAAEIRLAMGGRSA